MTTFSLDGKVVIITGAGRATGLGHAYAVDLARRGARVVVNDIVGGADETGAPIGADAVVAEIQAAGGVALASNDSITTAAGGAALVRRTVECFGSVDAVIHNAGSWRNAAFAEMTIEDFDSVLDVHLRGAFFTLQPAWRVMEQRGYGRIVLTSSGAGAWGRLNGANYVAAKAALLGLGKALSLEGESAGILVNCILPGAVTTTPEELAAAGKTPSAAHKAMSTARSETMESRRTPESVVPIVAYLASPECDRTGLAYSAVAGRFARTFMAVAEGWLAPTSATVSDEELVEHLDVIENTSSFTVPHSVLDEWAAIDALILSEQRATSTVREAQ